jgi:hypothetical protein
MGAEAIIELMNELMQKQQPAYVVERMKKHIHALHPLARRCES